MDLLISARPDLDRKTLADSAPVVTGLLAVQWIITLAVPLTYFKIRGYPLSAFILGFRRTKFWRAAGWLALIIIGTFVFEGFYNVIVPKLFGEGNLPSDVPSQNVTSLYGTSAAAILTTFVIVALITPVVEELFFRGIVHRGLEQALGFGWGATLSATVFALAHLDFRLFPVIFVLGFGLAFLVHKTGSIWTSIAGHFLINSLGVIAQYFTRQQGRTP